MNVAKHRIEFWNENTQPIHWKLYLSGLTMNKFENSEIGKELAQNINEAGQIEWAALIVFATKNDKKLQFSDD